MRIITASVEMTADFYLYVTDAEWEAAGFDERAILEDAYGMGDFMPSYHEFYDIEVEVADED